ncbi:uncharacterized protein LOC106474027 [Limulus polyphemus]|uniref:Uncharacterized protein LOC106474027 n=1 Tax=Limulus polyphemus TaxID=6850 RepID=A0ABM1BWS5_LIMPO|nr:uncharacterized protein LOC106474027 [Limulus polyphemus]
MELSGKQDDSSLSSSNNNNIRPNSNTGITNREENIIMDSSSRSLSLSSRIRRPQAQVHAIVRGRPRYNFTGRHMSGVSSNSEGLDNLLNNEYRKICRQINQAKKHIELLREKMRNIKCLLRRAENHKNHAFRYSMSLELSTVSGMEMMYGYFINQKRFELLRLRGLRYLQNHFPDQRLSQSRNINRVATAVTSSNVTQVDLDMPGILSLHESINNVHNITSSETESLSSDEAHNVTGPRMYSDTNINSLSADESYSSARQSINAITSSDSLSTDETHSGDRGGIFTITSTGNLSTDEAHHVVSPSSTEMDN